jgi:hypothetical protein
LLLLGTLENSSQRVHTHAAAKKRCEWNWVVNCKRTEEHDVPILERWDLAERLQIMKIDQACMHID